MLATQHFGIARRPADDWFDPILNADTELFVDPFLIFKDISDSWGGAHRSLIEHFDQAFRLIAEGNLNPESLQYQKALAMLVFREPKEFCLGYTSRGTSGSGSGTGYAATIGEAISEAIQRGLEHPRHFEELGILNEGIGADRISDITCTVLKSRLVEYTREIALRHAIPVANHRIFAGQFDERRMRWLAPEVEVPTNPFTEGPLLFVPQRFLRDLPVLNALDWWASYENEQLRQDMNYEIMGHVDKKTIVEIARRNPEAVRKWTTEREEQTAPPYDFRRDAKGVWQWDLASDSFVRANPLQLAAPQTVEEFLNIIDAIIGAYRLFVEDQGGWDLLWDVMSEKDKPERAAQLLFRGIAQSYCKANDISLDAEVNLGRGPVDFKFSNGYSRRAHLEVKKVHNGRFWDGLESQLPSYMRSDEVSDGWFLALQYNETKNTKNRIKELPHRIRAVAAERQINLRYQLVDARPKLSASRL
jgi:hypothetical protein